MEPTNVGGANSVRPRTYSTETLVKQISEAVIAAAAKAHKVPAEQIKVQSIAPEEFGSSALGLPEAGMIYASVMINGFVVRVKIGDKDATFHTNENASLVKEKKTARLWSAQEGPSNSGGACVMRW